MKAALSHLFNIHPWMYEHLTFGECRYYVGQAEAYLRETRRASQAAR